MGGEGRAALKGGKKILVSDSPSPPPPPKQTEGKEEAVMHPNTDSLGLGASRQFQKASWVCTIFIFVGRSSDASPWSQFIC